ncbi:MAG: stage III sporulation protein AF [Firmicutes bacterium]|nr:stage III sporulation protein AF [Bacillota bacterium]
MSNVSIYLLSIAGVVLLGVIIDLILHEGATGKYIKSIFALFVVFAIIAPLPKLLNGDIKLSDLFAVSTYNVDNNFLNVRKLEQAEKLKADSERHLSANGYSNLTVDFSLDPNTTDLRLLLVYVDFTNVVLSQNKTHINKYAEVRNLLVRFLNVEEGKVLMYG